MKKRLQLHGTLAVPGDKSISHRALMFSLLAQGTCRINRLSPAQDCRSTVACLATLGVDVQQQSEGEYLVGSRGLSSLNELSGACLLDAGNSGTTIRLLAGLLAGSKVDATLYGDSSLMARPMARVLQPLSQMGLQVDYLERQGYPPFKIKGGALHGCTFDLPVASAQVQTALLLAGLQAQGVTSVRLPHAARDHTERMFGYIGVPFTKPDALTTAVHRLPKPVPAFELSVAGDISSAAFFMVAAACLPGSKIILTEVGMNSGRTLIVDVLREMGAQVMVENEREICGEPVADITVSGSQQLCGVKISGARVAAGIDEIPILALAGPFCKGTLSVRDAQELRVKESDRLQAIAENMTRAGALISQQPDGFDIIGCGSLEGGCLWASHGDHRLAMAGMIARLICRTPVTVDDTACAAVSYPSFERDLRLLISD